MKNIIYRTGEEVRSFSSSPKEVDAFLSTLTEDQILWVEGVENELNTVEVKDWEIIRKHFIRRWSTTMRII